MTKAKAPKADRLNQLLAWLDADRDVAGDKYEEIRHSLIKIFTWGQCSDAEALADETIDRVAQKMPNLAETYVGEPALYFYGVAKNLLKEYPRQSSVHVPVEDDLAAPPDTSDDALNSERVYDCLDRCLQQLEAEDRRLILRYYQKDGQDKIDYRKKLADELGISLNALRVKVFRIREILGKCIEDCLKD